jgi:hypothetical protein
MDASGKWAKPLSFPSNAWWNERRAPADLQKIFAQVVLRVVGRVI